jgi:hypothetical protein
MRAAAIVVCLVFLVVSLMCVWFAGAHTGGYRERHKRYLDEHDLVAPVLASDPAFADIRIGEETGPGGGIFLVGKVKVGPALDRLKAELVRLFGEPRAKDLLSGGYFVTERDTSAPTPK